VAHLSRLLLSGCVSREHFCGFQIPGIKCRWKKRMNTSVSHSTVSRDLLNTFHRERERALCSFLCLLKVHLFEEMRE